MLASPSTILLHHGVTMPRSRSASMPSSGFLTLKFAALTLCVLLFAALACAAQSGSTGSVVLHGQRPGWALPENSQGAVPGDTTLGHLTLVLKRSPQQQQAFEQFLQQLQDRTSPNYHHFLTPVQIGEKFGASLQNIKAVSEWLSAQGLHVDAVANNRMMIDFSGNASQVGAAFGTEMRYYKVNSEQRIATADDPQIPAALAGVIQSISGLYTIKNRSYHGMGKAYKPKGGHFASPDLTFGCPQCLNFIMPADFATIYDLNDLTVDGTGQNVGIIGRSRVYDPDVENFQTLSGLGTKDPTVIIPPDGVDPGPPAGPTGTASGDQGEATLDVMRSTSIAPGATIDLIVSASTETEDGIQIATEYAVDTNPVPAQIISISFGACENEAGQAGDDYWDNLFSAAAGEGISVFVAAGDAGAAGCDDYFHTPPAHQILSINYICASSYATCVGGTEFNDVPESQYWNENGAQEPPFESALGPIPEGGWNEPLNGSGDTQAAAGGGGFSVFIATPSWQTGTGVPGTQGRYTPDVAFSASAHDGYFGCLAAGGGSCVVSGGEFDFVYFSGTSAAAPSMAGITALLNQQVQAPQGQLNQRLYQLAATPGNEVFNDATVTTSGVTSCAVTTPSMCNNSTPSPTGLTGGLAGYLLTAGYDEVTGLGSINGANLLSNWVAVSATATALVSSQNPQIQGATVTFTATVTTLGTNPPTGTVNFNDGNTQIGSGTLSTVGTAQVATFSTTTLAIGTHSITAIYAGDSNNAGSTSAPVSQVITAITTTTTLTSSNQTPGYGVAVTLTATVATTGSHKPTGTATFNNGNTAIGMSTLNGSQVATYVTKPTDLAVGANTITAVYGGDANNGPSTSSPLIETVTGPAFTLVNTGVTSTTVLAGVSGTGYAFTVAPVSPAPNFGGPVTLSCSFAPSDPTLIPSSCEFAGNGISNNVIAAGNGSTAVTLVITTAGPNGGGADRRRRSANGSDNHSPWLPLTLPLAGIVMVGFAGRKVWKHSAMAGLCVALLLIGVLVACGGSSSPPIGVSVAAQSPLFPNNANDGWPLQSVTFIATVTNTTNTAVTWAVTTPNGGTINPTTGVYVAPTVAPGLPANVTVVATSVADSTKTGTAQETIKPATIPGTYTVTVTATDPAAVPTTQTLSPTYTMVVN